MSDPIRTAGNRLGSASTKDERGEGVISAAIAVLVMAFLGVAMWIAFSGTLSTAVKHVNNQVSCVTGVSPGGAPSNQGC
jgi:hypothetical protein